MVLGMLEDKEVSWLEGLGDDSPKVKQTRRVYPRVCYTQAPWTVVFTQPSLSIDTSREDRRLVGDSASRTSYRGAPLLGDTAEKVVS